MNQDDMQSIFRTTLRDREDDDKNDKEDAENQNIDSKASIMITFTEFEKALLRSHLLFMSS